MAGTPLVGGWYDIAWTCAVLANLALVAVALQRLAAAHHVGRLVRTVLALAAVVVPFLGPGLVMLLVPAPERAADR
ncbi:hypothetical protein [Cellulomonas uda]|uniref:Uncharacterized protein n=1 Tax=Cellulomonas uda TaxID=1714 RepID=A0A4Y3KA36_CELUD|nr:hypothetical protein [Cellulomonas uda]NII66175.1 hypothetical protein [Cellulomonas uda]GEA80827.1 hypothetical protein CUD01_12710 [Cellulomonas uda]